MFTKTITATVLALSLAAGASTASAQTSDVVKVKVSVAGLNASSERGASIILRRIRNAAAEVCGPEPTAPLDRMAVFQPCVKSVTDHTVASLHNPMLTALNGGPSLSSTLASAR